MARFKLRRLVLLEFPVQSLPVGRVDALATVPGVPVPPAHSPPVQIGGGVHHWENGPRQGLEQVPGPVLRSRGRVGAGWAHLGALRTPCPTDACGWRRCEQGPLSMMHRAQPSLRRRAGDGDGGADGAGGSLGPQGRRFALRGEIQGWDVPTCHLKRCSFVTCGS